MVPLATGRLALFGTLLRHHLMCMFVRYYTFISQPFDEVSRELLDARSEWLPTVARSVNGVGLSLAELGVAVRGTRFHKTVEMSFGERNQQGASRISFPFRWKATAVPALFPTFDGDLQVSHWREGTTQLALSANYQPPLGPVGLMLDKAALHLVAEALVKDFLDRVASALETAIRTGEAVSAQSA